MSETDIVSRNPPGRSCVACRKRKIKCDRDQPCRYCSKLGVECIYLDAKPKEKEPSSEDVNVRLERIEALLQQLDVKVSNTSLREPRLDSRILPVSSADAATSGRPQHAGFRRNGRLIADDNDGKYVTHSFWTGLDEIGARREFQDFGTAASTPSTAPFTTTGSTAENSTPGSQDAKSKKLLQLHPTEKQLFALWQVYLGNVDPIFKLLHVPTTQRQLFQANQRLSEVPPAFEALMFSIYFAAITSMPSSVSFRAFHEDRPILLRRYRMGLEQALAKANFMSRPNVTIVQALVLFLTCARTSSGKDYVWSMVGLLIRLAMKLGLHRDPTDLGLSPFQGEMRRRLWWQIYVLDVRTAEDSDMNPFICEHTFNTKFPANVNDADLDVEMTQDLSGAKGRTEMLFTLLRIEVSYAVRNIIFTPELAADNHHSRMSSLAERRGLIDELSIKLENDYFQYCDHQIPICYLTETATRMIITKVKLTMHHPARNGSAYCQSVMSDLALRSVEIAEGAHVLRTSNKYSRWVWLFEKYVDWDAVAFLLHIINAAPSCVPLERAWDAIHFFFRDWDGRVTDSERWQRLTELRAKAAGKQSMPTASGSGATVNLRDQVLDDSTLQESSMLAFNAAEPTQPDTDHAIDRDLLMDLTPNYIDSVESENHGAAGIADGLDWTFDNFSFSQEGPSWDMDFADDVFHINGLH